MYFEAYSRWEWSCFLSWYSSFTPTQWCTWLGEPANHFHPLSRALWYLGLRRESRLLDHLLAAIRDRDILGVVAAVSAIVLPHAQQVDHDAMEESMLPHDALREKGGVRCQLQCLCLHPS